MTGEMVVSEREEGVRPYLRLEGADPIRGWVVVKVHNKF